MSSDASPQHTDTNLRDSSPVAVTGHDLVGRLLAVSGALLLVIALLLIVAWAGRRTPMPGAMALAELRPDAERELPQGCPGVDLIGVEIISTPFDAPETPDLFSARGPKPPRHPSFAWLDASERNGLGVTQKTSEPARPMVLIAAGADGTGDRQPFFPDGHPVMRMLAGDGAALRLDPSTNQPFHSRNSFRAPFNTLLGPEISLWNMPDLGAPAEMAPPVAWVLALMAVLLTLAAIYSALLYREAERRASITARLRATERELREQLSFNESLLHGLPVPVFIEDAAGRYVACNDAFADTVGLARSSILGRSVADIMPNHRASPHQEVAGPEGFQWREQRYDAENAFGGSLSQWLIFKSLFTVGDKTGVIGVALDITERKRTEGALKRSQQFFKQTLNTIPQPVFVKNFQHRFVFVNDAACLCLGFSREQMLGRTDHELFPLEQADKHAALDDLVFATGRSSLEETRITDGRGAEHVVLITKAAFDDDAGRPVLVGVITDITERKRSEEMLRIGAEVFEHSSEGIMITDDRARILMVNDAFVRITGFTEAEVLGRNARMIGSEQLSRGFYRSVYRSLKRHGFWKGEVVNRRRDGDRYVVEMPICAVRDDGGRVLRYIAMLTDITQRKNSEARVSYLAEHDFLTGLANRALLHDRAERAVVQAQRSGRKVAALLLDLDDFKLINDTWGHAVGDLLVQHVAHCLTAVVHEGDTVARYGGDEFVVLLPAVDEREDAGRVAVAITSALAKPFTSDSLCIHVGVSCGIAIYPDDANSVDGLFRAADAAMYRAKPQSRPESGAGGAGPGTMVAGANDDAERTDQKSIQRPLRSQSPKRVGSGPLGPPTSSADAAAGAGALAEGAAGVSVSAAS